MCRGGGGEKGKKRERTVISVKFVGNLYGKKTSGQASVIHPLKPKGP